MQSLGNRADHVFHNFLTDTTGSLRITEITNRFIKRCAIQGETVVEVITATLVGVCQLQSTIPITGHDLLDRIQQVLVVCTQITRGGTEVVAVCFAHRRDEVIIVHTVEEISQVRIINALDGLFITIGNFAGSGIFTVRVGNLVNHFIRTHRSHHDGRVTHDTHEGILECKSRIVGTAIGEIVIKNTVVIFDGTYEHIVSQVDIIQPLQRGVRKKITIMRIDTHHVISNFDDVIMGKLLDSRFNLSAKGGNSGPGLNASHRAMHQVAKRILTGRYGLRTLCDIVCGPVIFHLAVRDNTFPDSIHRIRRFRVVEPNQFRTLVVVKHVLIFTRNGLFNPIKVHRELVTVTRLAVHIRVLVGDNHVLSAIRLKYIGNLGSDVPDGDTGPTVADLVTGTGNARQLAIQFIILVLEHVAKDSISQFARLFVCTIFTHEVNRGRTDLFSPFSIRSQFISNEGVNVFRLGRRGTDCTGNKLVSETNHGRIHFLGHKAVAVLGKQRNDILRRDRGVNQVVTFRNIKGYVIGSIISGTTFALGTQRSITLYPISRILHYVGKCNLVRQRLHGAFNGFRCRKDIIREMLGHATGDEHGNFLIGNLADAFIIVDDLTLVGEVPLQHEATGILGPCTILDFLEPVKQRKVHTFRGKILHYINQVSLERLANVISQDIGASKETGDDIAAFVDVSLVDSRFVAECPCLFQTLLDTLAPCKTYLGRKHLRIGIIPIAATARHRSIAGNHLVDGIEEHRVIGAMEYRIDNR